MLVTDRHLAAPRELVDLVAAAAAGGVTLVQVREKDLPDDDLLALVQAIQRAAGDCAMVLVNGRPEIATAAGAGLHLPEAAPSPQPPAGGWPLWGRSVHRLERARRAVAEGVDYLLAGTLFATESKPGAMLLGLEGLREIVVAAGGTPVLAIGGITAETAGAAVRAGAAGVAVQRAILQAADPMRAARELRQALEAADAPAPKARVAPPSEAPTTEQPGRALSAIPGHAAEPPLPRQPPHGPPAPHRSEASGRILDH